MTSVRQREPRALGSNIGARTPNKRYVNPALISTISIYSQKNPIINQHYYSISFAKYPTGWNLVRPGHLSRQSQGVCMNIQKSALRATSFLTAASAVLWLGSAAAAPLPTAYPSNSVALFASVMQDPADD